MSCPPDVAHLTNGEWESLEQVADRFEAAWRTEGQPNLALFLPPPGAALRLVFLQELLKTDLEMRWRHGQGTTLEWYLERYPELGTADRLPADLVHEEYHVRQVHGDRPPLADYEARFPRQYAELVRLIEAEEVPTCPPAPAARAPGPECMPARNNVLDLDGTYRRIERIGAGGFGEVWRAEAPGGVEVAVKIIFRPVEEEEVLQEEASLELIKRLRHPFLLPIQAIHSGPDRLLVIMELADGNLRDRLRECRQAGLGGIPTRELLTYFHEAAEALDYLHGQHVQHRDIKPDNILLLGRHAKLADFGLARVLQSQRLVSVSGSGTPGYMAPEVWRGKACAASDQYSLAVSYAELRLQHSPFRGAKWTDIMLAHLTGTPDLAGLGEAEQQVLARALAKEPEERYPNCLEFVAALAAAVMPDPVPAAAPVEVVPAPVPAAPSWGQRLLGAAASLLVGAVLAGGAAWYWNLGKTIGEPCPDVEVASAASDGDEEPAPAAVTEGEQAQVAAAETTRPPAPEEPARTEEPARPEEKETPAPAPAPAAPEPKPAEAAVPKPAVPAPAPAAVAAAPVVPAPAPAPAAAAPVVPAPPDAAALVARGLEALEQKDYDRAVAEFSEAIRLDPQSAVAYKNRGDARALKKEYATALADESEAIRLDPTFARAFAARGWIYKMTGDPDRALADFSEALRLEPRNATFYAQRGDVYQRQGDQTRAVADFGEALQLGLKTVFVYSRRGFSYARQGQHDRAIADFTAALRLDPKSAALFNSRGSAYRAKNDLARALADYTSAIRLDPTYARAYLNRCLVHQQQGNLARARADYREAIRLDARLVGTSEQLRRELGE